MTGDSSCRDFCAPAQNAGQRRGTVQAAQGVRSARCACAARRPARHPPGVGPWFGRARKSDSNTSQLADINRVRHQTISQLRQCTALRSSIYYYNSPRTGWDRYAPMHIMYHAAIYELLHVIVVSLWRTWEAENGESS